MSTLGREDLALLNLLRALRARDYSFVTPTPATHARVIARRGEARDVREALGWSLPFGEKTIDGDIFALLRAAAVLRAHGALWTSAIRVSSLGPLLFIHSGYPTLARDSVFFGPDSYRFATFIEDTCGRLNLPTPNRIAEIGAGTGIGAIVAGLHARNAEIVLTDINPLALRFARVNAAFAGLDVRCIETSALDAASGAFDLIVANPPYIIDAEKRAYRDGGALYGGQVAVDWTKAALPHLAPGGAFLLYTGAAVIGDYVMVAALKRAADEAGCVIAECREIDPDVFGEELEREAYRDVERIAVIGMVFRRA